uniref:cellulase n=1 Tax=Psilocybe cubensis TaxID=181762 RepID=A0A8H8CGC2_PSICU
MSFLTISLLLGLGAVAVQAQSPLYGQCGGTGWTGATTCVSGATCVVSNPYYSQCLPGVASSSSTAKPTSTASSTSKPATSVPATSTSAPSPTCSASLTSRATGKLSHVGINIAGFDFGCNSDGSCTASGAWPPLLKYYGHDGEGQMQHFVNDDGFNTFRLPVGWQFLTNDAMSGTINQTNLAKYDDLVQACLATGASCIVDVHNYARFNGQIIGQGGPSNDVFAQLWTGLATKYASESKVIFGVMNEPHDVPDINLWAQSVQAAVTAIRKAGATTQLILLPGNNWTSAQTFVSNGSGAALMKVVNPDGSTTGLIFDVHKYLDSDNSGTNSECVTNNIEEAWAPLANWLRCNGRQAFNTETGGGNTASCIQYLCQQIAFQAQNSDVFLGYVGWAAGNFDPSEFALLSPIKCSLSLTVRRSTVSGYVLGETPTQSGSTWTDTSLVKSCLAPNSGSQSGPTS